MRLFILLLFFSFICQAQIVDRFTRFGIACTDIYAEGDALDPCSETNSLGSWAVDGDATQQIVNESDGDGGTYSIEVTVSTASSGTTNLSSLTLPALTDNATYTLEVRGKSDQNDGYLYVLGGFDGGNFAIGASVFSNGSYGDLQSTGKISDGTAPVLQIRSDQARPDVMSVAWVKITKTADP